MSTQVFGSLTPHHQKLWRKMLAKSFEPRQWFEAEEDSANHTGDKMMWVYRPVIVEGVECFEVGYYTPNGGWVSDSVFHDQTLARRRVNWLNGGKGSDK